MGQEPVLNFPVFRIRVQMIEIHKFLGLPDPDLLVRGTVPDPDTSIIRISFWASRIRICKSGVQIPRSRSLPRCHGYGTRQFLFYLIQNKCSKSQFFFNLLHLSSVSNIECQQKTILDFTQTASKAFTARLTSESEGFAFSLMQVSIS
jgi:hypothetical protein